MTIVTLEKSRFVIISQILLGYFYTRALNGLYTAIVVFVGFVLVLGEFIGFMNRTIVQEQVEMVFNVGAVLFFVFMYLAIRYEHRQLLEFVTIISRHADTSDDLRTLVLQSTVRKATEVIPKLLTIFACFLGCGVFSWCVTPLFLDFDYGNKNFYLGPFLYQCGDNGENRFPLKSLCLNVNTFFEYILVNCLHTLVVIWGCIVYGWAFTFLICILIFVDANLLVINERLLQLQKRAEFRVLIGFHTSQVNVDFDGLQLNMRSETALRDEFVEIIQYHQYLNRIFKTIIPFLQIVCNVLLVFYCTLISLAAFLIVNETKSTGYMLFRIKIGGVFVNATLALLICAYCSEVISEMHHKITEAVYFLPWYGQTVQFQKLVFQFQAQLKRSFQIRSLGMFAANLNMFTGLLRVTYSILNLMLAKFGRTQL